MAQTVSRRSACVQPALPPAKRAVLTIVMHSERVTAMEGPGADEEAIPAGWKTCFACHRTRRKTGLWACAGARYGTRRCDMCDGQGILPESEVDSRAHYGQPEERLPYED